MLEFEDINSFEIVTSATIVASVIYTETQNKCPATYSELIEFLKEDQSNKTFLEIANNLENDNNTLNNLYPECLNENDGLYNYIRDIIFNNEENESKELSSMGYIIESILGANLKVQECLEYTKLGFVNGAYQLKDGCEYFFDNVKTSILEFIFKNSKTIVTMMAQIPMWSLSFIGPKYGDIGVQHKLFTNIPIILSLKIASVFMPDGGMKEKVFAGVNSYSYFHTSKSFCKKFGPVKANGSPNYLSPFCMTGRVGISTVFPIINHNEENISDFIYNAEDDYNDFDNAVDKGIKKGAKKAIKEYSKIPFPENPDPIVALKHEVLKYFAISYLFKSKESTIDYKVASSMLAKALVKVPMKRLLQNNELMLGVAETFGVDSYITHYLPDFFEQLDGNYMYISFMVSTIAANSYLYDFHYPYFFGNKDSNNNEIEPQNNDIIDNNTINDYIAPHYYNHFNHSTKFNNYHLPFYLYAHSSYDKNRHYKTPLMQSAFALSPIVCLV